jgi:hypothetical protein
MFIMGHHLYEWEKAIEHRPINTAKAMIDYYGEDNVIVWARCKLDDRIRGKAKLITEIQRQLLERPIKSWNRGHVKL